jgi:hypothetical protein
MTRRFSWRGALIFIFLFACTAAGAAPLKEQRFIDTPTGIDWLARWERNITDDARNRYCDGERGEELGWRVSPFLNGFHSAYRATLDPRWIERLIDWTDSCIRRGVREPDGFTGWPKGDGGGGDSRAYSADSLLGEAMLMRPVVLMAQTIQKDSQLNAKYGAKAREYLALAESLFAKWDSSACWRATTNGGVWIVPAFGIDSATGGWSAGYTNRTTTGFTNPDNKENHIALWMLAMHDATGKAIYRDRAEHWFRVMKSRMKRREDGKYWVWNYWEPAGPWDFQTNGTPKHWIGVHPNGGYYAIDLEAIVCAYQHDLVFTRADLDRLIATNRDFMWNQSVENARFQRIDGEPPDPRWKNSPGLLWEALLPYDKTLRTIFIANHNPASWGGLASTPRFLADDNAGLHPSQP